MKKHVVYVGMIILCFLTLTGCMATHKTMSKGIVDSTFSVPNGDHTIPVTLTMPIGEGEVPVVVMMHGTGSNKDEAGNAYLMLAPKMAKAGIAAARFDFPGSGDSTASYELYSNTEAIRDCEAVAAFVSGMAGIDKNRIGVMGWSQGGTDALLAAGSSNTFSSVLTWAGALELGDMATPEMRSEAEKQGYTFMEFEWREPLKLSKKWIDEVDTMDVLSYAAKIKAPIASIHGTVDTTVPFTDSEKVQAVSRNPKSKLIPIEGADHLYGVFSGDLTLFEELSAKTIEWFKSTL
ncbi:prolyl oligopeptidase family protein [Sphaerochaeta pleomorpha str. Grapes]|uniref:Prolyl oligopeptidase family protein n=1 Tax=Sphaerochaeta pleomorpha (strain ATCC BAA-1885 / DSM 22778 / Grapes) TaxID=158190 RepID=G8QQ58_SPHPG|nr:alpha/beta fold hydrolase [Sphaerochaeta pleomorpha]AEV28635.1 prolyl oligopeptidase family protein [Sphaerochaeta pleomorpha str. Grapes]